MQVFDYVQVTVACVKSADCVRLLLDHGADPTTTDHAVRATVYAYASTATVDLTVGCCSSSCRASTILKIAIVTLQLVAAW